MVRKYAREWDDRESEVPPAELPKAKDYPGVEPLVAQRKDDGDTSRAVLEMLMTAERSWGDYSVAIRRGKSGLGNAALLGAGTPEQIKKWNHLFLAMAITEPGCGSDPSMVETSARRDGDMWVLNGEKIFVTGGVRCQGVVAWATLDRAAGRAGIKSFLMKGTPGFILAHKEKKLGIRRRRHRCHRVPGLPHPARQPARWTGGRPSRRQLGRLPRRAGTLQPDPPRRLPRGLGMAKAALDFTRDQLVAAGWNVPYQQSRRTLPAVVESLHRLEAQWEASMLTVLHAAWLAGRGEDQQPRGVDLKAKGAEIARTATQRCLALLGSMGISYDFLLEKWFRDCRITDIYEGTGQIQRLIIARDILGYGRKELS